MLTYRGGDGLWIEVTNWQGTFYVTGTGSVFDLVERLVKGGHWVRPPKKSRSIRHGKDEVC